MPGSGRVCVIIIRVIGGDEYERRKKNRNNKRLSADIRATDNIMRVCVFFNTNYSYTNTRGSGRV